MDIRCTYLKIQYFACSYWKKKLLLYQESDYCYFYSSSESSFALTDSQYSVDITKSKIHELKALYKVKIMTKHWHWISTHNYCLNVMFSELKWAFNCSATAWNLLARHGALGVPLKNDVVDEGFSFFVAPNEVLQLMMRTWTIFFPF